MVNGPRVYICDECIAMCGHIISEAEVAATVEDGNLVGAFALELDARASIILGQGKSLEESIRESLEAIDVELSSKETAIKEEPMSKETATEEEPMSKETELLERRVGLIVNLLRVPKKQAREFVTWADADALSPQMGASGPHQSGWKAWAICRLMDTHNERDGYLKGLARGKEIATHATNAMITQEINEIENSHKGLSK